jgi:hypothetical protein
MEIEGGSAAAVREAIFAVGLAEKQEAGAVNGHHEVSLESEGVQGLRSDEPADTPGSQSGKSMGADMTEEVVESFVDGQGVLLGARQAIGIVQYLQFGIAQLVIQLAAAAQLEAEQQQPPPGEKSLVIADEGAKPRVGQLSELGIEGRPEVANRFDEGAAQLYDLPARRLRAVT